MRLIGTLFATFACCVAALQAQTLIPVTLNEGVCAGIANTGECAEAIEARQLPLSHGRAQRVRGALQLRLATGKQIVISDDSTAEWPSWFNYLGSLNPPGYYVLWAQHPEGNSIELVSARRGWRATIDDMPILSPDSHRFATASLDLEAEYNPNRLTIWRVSGDTLLREWSIAGTTSPAGTTWGPEDVVWLSNTALRFARVAQLDDGSPTMIAIDTASLSEGVWSTKAGQ